MTWRRLSPICRVFVPTLGRRCKQGTYNYLTNRCWYHKGALKPGMYLVADKGDNAQDGSLPILNNALNAQGSVDADSAASTEESTPPKPSDSNAEPAAPEDNDDALWDDLLKSLVILDIDWTLFDCDNTVATAAGNETNDALLNKSPSKPDTPDIDWSSFNWAAAELHGTQLS